MVLAAAFLGITVQANALARDKVTLQAEIASTLGEQSTLKEHIATQKTDDYVTQVARNLGLIGQNETLFGVQRETVASDPSARSATRTTTHVEKWIAFFFGSR
jgi:cell division protein FtsB